MERRTLVEQLDYLLLQRTYTSLPSTKDRLSAFLADGALATTLALFTAEFIAEQYFASILKLGLQFILGLFVLAAFLVPPSDGDVLD
jgi:hypothetical protein